MLGSILGYFFFCVLAGWIIVFINFGDSADGQLGSVIKKSTETMCVPPNQSIFVLVLYR